MNTSKVAIWRLISVFFLMTGWFGESAFSQPTQQKSTISEDILIGLLNESAGASSPVHYAAQKDRLLRRYYVYVDLGLSVKWAICNLGTYKPEENGDYYSWGETRSKKYYWYDCYLWYNQSTKKFTKYVTDSEYGTVDNKKSLDISDDAARKNWGAPWRMPTREEWNELITKCTWTWTNQGRLKGFKVTGPNGKSIFLSASGCWWGDSIENMGESLYYWSSTLDTDYPHDAWVLHGADYMDAPGASRSSRYYGLVIRPVLDKP